MRALLLLALACSTTPSADKADGSDDTATTGDDGVAPDDSGDTAGTADSGDPEEPAAPPRSIGCADTHYEAVIEADGSQTVHTEHYDLHLDPTADADDLARLVEAAYQAYAEDLGAEPLTAGPLQLLLFADQPTWVSEMAALGVSVPPAAGGYYDPTTETASLYRQPTLYFTEMLLLHEAFHQFHLQSRTRTDRLSTWYVEGLAEWVSRHDWDGSCVTVGADPRGTLEDYWAAAAAGIDERGSDLSTWMADDSFPGRPEMMTFVHAQEWTNRAAWRAYRDGQDFSAPTTLTVDDAAYADHIAHHQEPLLPIWLEWQHRSPTVMRGITPGVLSAILYKETPATVSFTVPLTGAAYVGGVYGWSDDGFDLILVDAAGNVSRWTYTTTVNDWVNIDILTTVGDTLTYEQTGADLRLNGQSIALTPVLPPAAGMVLYDGTADFTTLED